MLAANSLKTKAAGVLFASLLASATASAADYEIRLGQVTSDEEPIQQAIEEFATKVSERTDGRVEITIFPNGQLGTNPEVYEQLRAGAPIITISDPGYLSDFVPDFGVLGGPYLMDDPLQFSKLEGTDLYNGMIERLRSESGIELLAMNWLFGSRHLINDKPGSTPKRCEWSDSTHSAEHYVGRNVRSDGYAPHATAVGRGVFRAIRWRCRCGRSSPALTLWCKIARSQKVVSMTGHFKGFTGLVINADYFANLPEDIQQALSEEALAAGEFMTKLMLASEEEWVAKLEGEGVTFNRDVDIAAFQNETASVYDQFPEWSPGLYENVRDILDN